MALAHGAVDDHQKPQTVEWHPGVPCPPIAVSEYTIDPEAQGWIDKAAEILKTCGFVVILDVLNTKAIDEVRDVCESVASEMLQLDPHGWGNRGPRRYSFGEASLTGQLTHHWCFTKHLLDNMWVREVVSEVFQGEVCAYGSGGEFVLANTHEFQRLHSDVGGQKAYEARWPPPHLIANFFIENRIASHGPTRLIPDHMRVWPPHPDYDKWEEQASHHSLLAPVPCGAVVLRVARTLHSGSPNRENRTRYLPNAAYFHRAFCGQPGCPPVRSCIPKAFFEHLSDQLVSWSQGLELSDHAECGIRPGFALKWEERERTHHWCYDCRKWRLCCFDRCICRQLGRSCTEPCDRCHQSSLDTWCSHE